MNPDSMHIDELIKLIDKLGMAEIRLRIRLKDYPESFGPKQYKRAKVAHDNLLLLQDYCLHKVYAIRHRNKGEIRWADINEDTCDRLYGKLPAKMRW